MKKVILYGIGVNCDAFIRYARGRDFEVAAYVDKNKADELYRGARIKRPAELCCIEFDEIFLMVGENTASIKDYLVHEIGVAEEQIKDTYYLNKRYMLYGAEKYKYVLINARSKQYEILYNDLKRDKDFFCSCLLVCENKWTFTSEEHNNETSKIIMFVFEYGLSCECLQYFKMKFPAATVVLSFNDMISGTNGYEQIFENFSLNRLKEISDLIFTYHSIEAEKYDLYYYPQIFSKKELPPEKIKYDVFFVGLAKNRLDMLHAVYKKLTDEGVSCNFWISGVSEEQMLKIHGGIIYNQALTYEEYLNEANKSRCILDVVQVGDIHSTRYTESVAYNKKYLTNDITIEKDTFYHPQYMQAFQSIEQLNCRWIKEPIAVDYEYQEQFSPLNLVQAINKKLLTNA